MPTRKPWRIEEAEQIGAELMRRGPALTLATVRIQQPWKDKQRMDDFIAALRAAGVPDG